MYRFSKVVRGKDARWVPLQSEGWRICPLWILNSVSSVIMSLRKSRGVPLGLLTSSPFSFCLGFTRFTRCFIKSCTLWTFSLGVSCFSIFTGVWHWKGHRAWSLCCFNVFFPHHVHEDMATRTVVWKESHWTWWCWHWAFGRNRSPWKVNPLSRCTEVDCLSIEALMRFFFMSNTIYPNSKFPLIASLTSGRQDDKEVRSQGPASLEMKMQRTVQMLKL